MDSYGFPWVSEGSSEFRIQGTNPVQLFKSVGIPQEIPVDSYGFLCIPPQTNPVQLFKSVGISQEIPMDSYGFLI